jgi:hypothetical protein
MVQIPMKHLDLQKKYIESEIAYSLSGIISGCLDYHRLWSDSHKFDERTLEILEVAIHKIAFAWDQVLAGDASDILEGFRDNKN